MTTIRTALLACLALVGCHKSTAPATQCVPSCSGKTCGDNGCGGSCGACQFGDVCGADGTCAACNAGPSPILFPAEPGAASSDDYIDPVTQHRVVRLSRLPGSNSNFYFTQNSFNCRGNQMLFANAHDPVGRMLYSVDLTTYAVTPIVASQAATFELVGKKHNEVYFGSPDWKLHATNLATLKTRDIAQLPADSGGFVFDANEKLLLGTTNQGLSGYQQSDPNNWQLSYYKAHLPSQVMTIDSDSGAITTVFQDNNWLDHANFSPTDPNLLMFYHEGAETTDTDRIWVMDKSSSAAPHSLRTIMPLSLITHEFWSPDGTRIYYGYADWTGPTPPLNFLSSTNVASGANVDVALQPDQWGLHYNISPDQTLFASDGGFTRTQILLYKVASDGSVTVQPLADITGNNTNTTQPNVQFTPDGQWVVFLSAHTGSAQVYAVSVQ